MKRKLTNVCLNFFVVKKEFENAFEKPNAKLQRIYSSAFSLIQMPFACDEGKTKN